jgi:DNA-binding MarR family transcriptional regulator
MSRHDTDEQVLYRGVSMARNLAHLGHHDEAAIVAEIAVKAYREQNYRPDEAPRAVADGGDDVDRGEGVETDGGRSTRVGHCRRDDVDVYIGRGNAGQDVTNTEPGEHGWLGNPFHVDDYGREGCIDRFRDVFETRLLEDDAFRRAVRRLAGQTLGCWCRRVDADEPACHGDVIAEWADRLDRQLVTDGGHARLADLSGFQRDLLVAFGKLDRTDALPANGQEVQTVVEAVRDERVTHGRHYPNLDALAEAGLIDKHVDGLTNRSHGYALTAAGRAALDERLEQLADATGQRVTSAAADGGRR